MRHRQDRSINGEIDRIKTGADITAQQIKLMPSNVETKRTGGWSDA
jgi:hypothetical protein